MEPASLTKLMTAYIVFQELAAGKLKLDEQVMVSEHAWRSEGSRTFIELGKPVSVEDPDPGHDRAVGKRCHDCARGAHRRHRGDVRADDECDRATPRHGRQLISRTARDSLRPSTTRRRTTCRCSRPPSFATIPQYYKWFSVREFEHNGIKQQNRNGLLEKDPTVDGLKTGHTDSAGFCLVTSSLRDGMRLVSVVMGSTSMKGRENASAALLNYGFTFYDTKLVVKGGAVLASTHGLEGADPARRSWHQGRSLHHPAARRGRTASRPPPTCSRV